MTARPTKPGPKKAGRRRSKPANLSPALVVFAIALLLAAFVYWSERASAPVKPAAVAVRREPVSPKKTGPAKIASAVPAGPAVTAKPVTRASVIATIAEKVGIKAEREEKKRVLPPPPVAGRPRAKVAIVIDDFGYNMNNVESFFDIKLPITLAVLPRQRYSREIAEMARSRGHEVILHLPLESWRPEAREEADTIRTGMTGAEVTGMLAKEVSGVPGLKGVSNHQGSKATEDRQVMADIMKYLKKRDLYFFDSFTTPRSVGREVAAEMGVRFARRSRFLDNENDEAAIEKQLSELKVTALARGKAVAIGHDRKKTAAVLARVMPEMAKDGIEFVYLSEMVR